jgi:hypothetical protein
MCVERGPGLLVGSQALALELVGQYVEPADLLAYTRSVAFGSTSLTSWRASKRSASASSKYDFLTLNVRRFTSIAVLLLVRVGLARFHPIPPWVWRQRKSAL